MDTYECVKSFCYLGGTLDGDGGADLAATARIRNGWMKLLMEGDRSSRLASSAFTPAGIYTNPWVTMWCVCWCS